MLFFLLPCGVCKGSSHQDAVIGLAGALAVGVGIHALGKTWEWYKISGRDEPSQEFQQYARGILRGAQACNAESVSFKLDTAWLSYGGGYIGIDKKDEKPLLDILGKKHTGLALISSEQAKLVQVKSALLHENKHVQNRDSLKICLMGSLCFYIIHQAPPLHSLDAVCGCFGLFVGYKRYTEYTADEYAYQNMSKIELQHEVSYWQGLALKCKNDFKDTLPAISVLVSKIVSFFSSKVWGGTQSDHQEKILFKINSFFRNPQHPDYLTRAALAQQYADQN